MFITGFTVALGLIPVSAFHELGHIVICVSHSGTYKTWFDGINFDTQCSIPTEPIWVINSMGGIFGIIISLTPIIIRKIRKTKGILLGLITLGFSQVVNGTLETFMHDWYVSPNSKPSITIIMAVFMAIIILTYGIPKKASSKSSN